MADGIGDCLGCCLRGEDGSLGTSCFLSSRS